MEWLNWISTSITSIAKEGFRLTTIIIILAALLKVPWVQRAVIYLMPKRFKPKHHASNTDVLYELRELRQALGEMNWDADLRNGEHALGATTGVQRKSSLPQAGYAPATSARYSTLQKGTSRSQQRRMNMKSKLLSRKFILAVVSALLVILNDGLDLGIDSDTVLTFAGLVATYIIGESAVDVSNKNTGGTTNDSTLTTTIESNE